MPRVICCRHGQSIANAGAATTSPLDIALTPFGEAQARALAEQWQVRPRLMVCSPAVRAIATAQPTRQRFPETPFECWPIQEFTYLDPARCSGTTVAERRAWVEDYWTRADPGWRDSSASESFDDFMQRVCTAIHQLSVAQIGPSEVVLLFGHGQFINAMRWQLAGAAAPWDMRAYRAHDLAKPIEHCVPIDLKL